LLSSSLLSSFLQGVHVSPLFTLLFFRPRPGANSSSPFLSFSLWSRPFTRTPLGRILSQSPPSGSSFLTLPPSISSGSFHRYLTPYPLPALRGPEISLCTGFTEVPSGLLLAPSLQASSPCNHLSWANLEPPQKGSP